MEFFILHVSFSSQLTMIKMTTTRWWMKQLIRRLCKYIISGQTYKDERAKDDAGRHCNRRVQYLSDPKRMHGVKIEICIFYRPVSAFIFYVPLLYLDRKRFCCGINITTELSGWSIAGVFQWNAERTQEIVGYIRRMYDIRDNQCIDCVYACSHWQTLYNEQVLSEILSLSRVAAV